MFLLLKETLRGIKKSFGRFLSVFFIVALGVGFFAGIRQTSSDMRYTADKYYDTYHLMDGKVFSYQGFQEKDKALLEELDVTVTLSYTVDVLEGSYPVRVHSLEDVNTPRILEGRMPSKTNEVLAQHGFYEIGDIVTTQDDFNALKEDVFEVVGLIDSPLYVGTEKATTTIGNGKIRTYFYTLPENFTLPAYTELYFQLNDSKKYDCYSDEYRNKIEALKEKIEEKDENYIVLTRENVVIGYDSLEGDADRVSRIAKVFPVFFLLVAALVCMNTMTRMVEDERGEIGILKALGYKNYQIVFTYLLYVLIASVIGSIIGVLIGCNILPRVIFEIYSFIYRFPPLSVQIKWKEVALIIGCMTFLMLFVTYLVCYKMLKEKSADLLRPKAPKIGKKILLERISFLWTKINFTWKVSLRNLFRYKKRIFMTVLGIAGCTALTLTGFGLRDSIVGIVKRQFSIIQTYDGIFILKQSVSELNEKITTILEENEQENPTLMKQELYTFSSNNKEHDVYVVIPSSNEEYETYVKLQTRGGKEKLSIMDNGVIINEKMATILHKKVGDFITIQDQNQKEYELKINGITENYVYNYIYMDKKYYEEIFDKNVSYNMIITENKADNHDQVISNLLDSGYFYNASFMDDSISNFQTMIDNLNQIVVVILIAACLLEFIVLYNLTTINMMERVREIATLKVLGFYDKEVSSYVYRETILLTIFGIFVGLFLGIFLHQFVMQTAEMDFMMFQRTINGISYVYTSIITVLFSIVVLLFTHFKLKKIDMIESLKSVE